MTHLQIVRGVTKTGLFGHGGGEGGGGVGGGGGGGDPHFTILGGYFSSKPVHFIECVSVGGGAKRVGGGGPGGLK